MDYTAQLELLTQRASDTLVAAKAAAAEDRLTVRSRIDQARADLDLALKDARLKLDDVADVGHVRWAQLKADAAAKLAEVTAQVKQSRRGRDARGAAVEADWAEADAFDAIDYAEWAIDNARLAVLDAIDARLRADELATH